MKKIIAFALLGFALASGAAITVIVPAASALASCDDCK
jgi:hypothetical protein